jgi:hypothetical protein
VPAGGERGRDDGQRCDHGQHEGVQSHGLVHHRGGVPVLHRAGGQGAEDGDEHQAGRECPEGGGQPARGAAEARVLVLLLDLSPSSLDRGGHVRVLLVGSTGVRADGPVGPAAAAPLVRQVHRWARSSTAHQGRRGSTGGGARPLKLTQPPGPMLISRGAAGRLAQRRPTAVAPATAKAPTAMPA